MFRRKFVLGLSVALAVCAATLPAAGAQSREPASRTGIRDLSSAAASAPGLAFIHTATAANTAGHSTFIDHPLTNDNPNAIVLVTQNRNPGGVGGSYNKHYAAVYYRSAAKKWAILNQDFAGMPDGAAFNVLIPGTGADAFVHTARTGNIRMHGTYLDHPLFNDNPNAIVLLTQNGSPGGALVTFNNHPIELYYDGLEKRWAVVNQDRADMPDGAGFNVLIPAGGVGVFVHRATAANIAGSRTYIDHPLTNDNPNAIVLVTKNLNPGGVGDTHNEHPIGVVYSNGEQKWAVFNQDLTSMPDGAAYNVMVIVSKIYLPIVLR
jgi:hypothetical protein